MYTLVVCAEEDTDRLRAANPEIPSERWETLDRAPRMESLFEPRGLLHRLGFPGDQMHVLLTIVPRARIRSVHWSNAAELVPYSQALLQGAHYAYAIVDTAPNTMSVLKSRDNPNGGMVAGLRFPFLGLPARPANQEKAINDLRLLLDEHAEHFRVSQPRLHIVNVGGLGYSGVCVILVSPTGEPRSVAGLIGEALPHLDWREGWVTNSVGHPFLVLQQGSRDYSSWLHDQLEDVGIIATVTYLPFRTS